MATIKPLVKWSGSKRSQADRLASSESRATKITLDSVFLVHLLIILSHDT